MGWAAWIGLGIEVALWLLLADLDIQSLPILVLSAAILFLGTWICISVLIVHHRRFFGTWYGVAGLVTALVLVSWGRGIVPPGNGTNLLLIALVALVPALPLSLVLLFWKRDVSAELLGLVLLAFVWGSLLASMPYGGPIRAWIQYVSTPETGDFWWFESLTCLMMIVLPLGTLTFLVHLIRLGLKEIHGD